MSERFARTKILYGEDEFKKISSASVLVCGIGAVGGFATESLARCGVENFTLVDFDIVEITNINRQLCALESTIGKKKVDVMRERILDINPMAIVKTFDMFLDEGTIPILFNKKFSVIIDAIDSISSKIFLLEFALTRKIPIVSSMGAARKYDSSKITTGKLLETYNCNLAAKIRKELRKRNVSDSCECVFSTEIAREETHVKNSGENRKIIGSTPIVTGIFGLKLADIAMKEILNA